MRRVTTLGLAALTAIAFVGGVACDDDDDGDGDNRNEAAAALAGTFDNLKRDLTATENIEEAPDNIKDGLKDDCDALRDGIDSDGIDEYCDDLADAIDDEDQTEYTRLRSQFSSVEALFVEEVGDRLDEDDEDDSPFDEADD
jgi:hypothetical protein